MEFYLQFGYGMMDHCRALIDEWGGGCVILSPRDHLPEYNQLPQITDDILGLGGEVLLDPQFYLPQVDEPHERLAVRSYWPDDYDGDNFWDRQNGGYPDLIQSLFRLNEDLGTKSIILPGIHASELANSWYEHQGRIQDEAQELSDEDSTLLATVSLAPEPLQNREDIRELIDESEDWPVDGFYLVCQHPPGQYIVENPSWLRRMMDLIASWRLRGKEVILGYANQQMLVTACVAPTAIASGNWKNVRSFPPNKFRDRDIDRRRSTWYYAPQALSEYKMEFLDVAHEEGILDQMAPPDRLGGGYAEELFTGPEPSAIGLDESPNSFRHYLLSLNQQLENLQHDSFEGTLDSVKELIQQAGRHTSSWSSLGISGADREFTSSVQAATQSALSYIERTHAPRLSHHWSDII